MQFLVYLTVLMVSISTVLLEVHWLTSPAPQPKPAVQAVNSPPPARIVEGPTQVLRPVSPKPEATPAASAAVTSIQPQESQPPVNTAAAAPAAVAAANPEPRKPATETTRPVASPPEPKPVAETTGAATRPEETKLSATPVSVPASTSNNRCDVQACSSAYQSFRAADCTYQPFEGPRRVCEKPPAQQRTARDQTERPERRQWSRDVAPRDGERTIGRRVYDDPDESNADDDDDDSGRTSIFGIIRGPRW